jgi:hypothetical protein
MNADNDVADRQILARCAVCQVERCVECDTVHLHIGHTSLRLTMAAFLSLSTTLIEAAQEANRAVVPATPHRAAN